MELVAADRDRDPGSDLEGFHEALVLRGVIRLSVIARLRLEVDRRDEGAEGLGLAVEIGHEHRVELEEELPDPSERSARGTRLVCGVDVVLAGPRARQKA